MVLNASVPFASFVQTYPGYGYLALLFIPVLTILGNILVIMAVLRDKQLKKSITNRYIAALAFSDLLVGVIPMPLAVYVKVNGEEWSLGVGLCKFYVACDVTSSTASILHLVVISTDRYLAVSWPAEYQLYARKAKITFAIVLIWLISITLSIPVIMGKSILNTNSCWLENPEYMIYSSLLSFYIPAGVLTLVYVKIFRKIRLRYGIHSMLTAGPGTCRPDVPSFHLPFVVVQEVSYDDQPTPSEKRSSDALSLAPPHRDSRHSAASFPNDLSTLLRHNNSDNTPTGQINQHHEQLAHNDTPQIDQATTKPLKTILKSKTFPADDVDKTERTSCLKESMNENRVMYGGLSERANRSNAKYGIETVDDKEKEQNGLTSRKVSGRRASEYKEREGEARVRRLSLWFHHSCQHVSEIVSNGNYLIEHEDDDALEVPLCAGPSTRQLERRGSPVTTTKRRRWGNFSMRPRCGSHNQPRVRTFTSSSERRSAVCAAIVPSSPSIDLGSRDRSFAGQMEAEESDCNASGCYALTGSIRVPKRKSGFYFKKLANRVTNALTRITETQAVTKEKKATKLVALILGVFVISWLPFFTFNSARGVCLSAISSPAGCDWLPSQVFFLTTWLGYANSAANPIIYALVNQRFRATYKRLLWWPSRRHS